MEHMSKQGSNLFRQKPLERISSPDQLTDYLRVTGPGLWALLAVVVLLLAGLLVWSMSGNLETLQSATAVVEDGTAQIAVPDAAGDEVQSGMAVRVGGEEYRISAVEADDDGHVVAYAPVAAADGRYDVQIVVESIHPIRFLFD